MDVLAKRVDKLESTIREQGAKLDTIMERTKGLSVVSVKHGAVPYV